MRELRRSHPASLIEPGPRDSGIEGRVWLPAGLSPEALKLHDELAHCVVTPEAAAELRAYLDDCFRRLLTTLSLVPRGDGRILELGANPYFFTILLRRFRAYEVELANFFGGERNAVQRIVNDLSGEAHEFEYTDFNLEEEEFPYPDEHFDGVVYCEILEHLVRDPIATLAGIHRALRPGGWLVLTTPNVARRHNLVRLKRGQNIYDPYSGYGPYGRHNREYTVGELRELLTRTGFAVEKMFTRDLHPCSRKSRVLAAALGSDSGYNLYALARRGPDFSWYYPPWLFRSGGIRRRIRDPFVRFGVNDAVQIGDGWWDLELWADGAMRWTRGKAEIFVRANGGERRLRLLLSGGPPERREAPRLSVRIGSDDARVLDIEAPLGKWSSFELDLPEPVPAGEIKLLLESPAFVPADVLRSGDRRTLGVGVRAVELRQ
jgi:SAM-dependent methyltransferase